MKQPDRIKGIIFDIGGVLLTDDSYPIEQEEFMREFGITQEQIKQGWKTAWPDFRVGKFEEEKFWEIFLEHSGAKNADAQKAADIWRRHTRENEEMLEVLPKLKEKFKLGIITNIGKGLLEYKVSKFGLDTYFDVIVSSAHFGISKPDPKIYEVAILKMGLLPEEIIFVDDLEWNVAAAKEAGMKAIQFKSKKQLAKELKKLGVSV